MLACVEVAAEVLVGHRVAPQAAPWVRVPGVCVPARLARPRGCLGSDVVRQAVESGREVPPVAEGVEDVAPEAREV